MRDFSLLDSAIDEMERVLLGNKPREAERSEERRVGKEC